MQAENKSALHEGSLLIAVASGMMETAADSGAVAKIFRRLKIMTCPLFSEMRCSATVAKSLLRRCRPDDSGRFSALRYTWGAEAVNKRPIGALAPSRWLRSCWEYRCAEAFL